MQIWPSGSKIEDYFTKKKNVIYERARFNQRRQEEGESLDTFITALYTLASKCEYVAFNDKMIQDRIVIEISNPALSEKMQLDDKLTLEEGF